MDYFFKNLQFIQLFLRLRASYIILVSIISGSQGIFLNSTWLNITLKQRLFDQFNKNGDQIWKTREKDYMLLNI